ncbi:hypothetical protein GA0070607_0029 [Micromonospora coriariae]|uniref:Uncharacterized protein n=1 Tax=Micromonospora coriariae TaxID=285665 RepID=A0A1C4U252_9ACTN|nr:hypothetical protein [Micromonospora coriariae]SCE65687.1 hypothetical protein GA0070607_0029 [Micromonospora coriariae]
MISIVDETTAGRGPDAWHLEIFEERLPLREVIRRRVFQEVAEHNARRSGEFRGLVQPSEIERGLNGAPVYEHRRVDPHRQYDRAVEAFSRNGFIVLVDDRQVEDLDAQVDLRTGTEIMFLRLVPLVGG